MTLLPRGPILHAHNRTGTSVRAITRTAGSERDPVCHNAQVPSPSAPAPTRVPHTHGLPEPASVTRTTALTREAVISSCFGSLQQVMSFILPAGRPAHQRSPTNGATCTCSLNHAPCPKAHYRHRALGELEGIGTHC